MTSLSSKDKADDGARYWLPRIVHVSISVSEPIKGCHLNAMNEIHFFVSLQNICHPFLP
jgi:hypothetical protein